MSKGTRAGTRAKPGARRGRPRIPRIKNEPLEGSAGVPAVSGAPGVGVSGEGHVEKLGYDSAALAAFAEIVRNPDAPAMSRTHAARALAEISGLLGRHQQAPREREHAEHVSLLTRAELERELVRLRAVFRGDMEPRP